MLLWFAAFAFFVYFAAFRAAADAWAARLRQAEGKATHAGFDGATVARRLLAAEGIEGVRVERSRRADDACYDPRRRLVLLGADIFGRTHLAAMALAACAVAEVLVPTETLANRRLVTRFLHPFVGLALCLVLVAAVLRPVLWKAALAAWGLGALLLLGGHAMTLSVEYRLVACARRLLTDAGLVAAGEQANLDEFGKGLPLRTVKGVGSAIRHWLGALLPFKGWR